ncbi:hypothetical protein RSAG8_05609, partial [Rhizoctonia solani AG-8 WAC10335]
MSLGTLFARSIRPVTTSFSGIHGSAIPRVVGYAPPCLTRYFSLSCIVRATHYETLGVPQNATKGQIKASFYNTSSLASSIILMSIPPRRINL